eukprot:5521937-Amphidinium_carterae.2
MRAGRLMSFGGAAWPVHGLWVRHDQWLAVVFGCGLWAQTVGGCTLTPGGWSGGNELCAVGLGWKLVTMNACG